MTGFEPADCGGLIIGHIVESQLEACASWVHGWNNHFNSISKIAVWSGNEVSDWLPIGTEAVLNIRNIHALRIQEHRFNIIFSLVELDLNISSEGWRVEVDEDV